LSNYGLLVAQFPPSSLFCDEITGPIFAKILHDVEALVTLLSHADARQYCISFENAIAKSEHSQFLRLEYLQKVTFRTLSNLSTFATAGQLLQILSI